MSPQHEHLEPEEPSEAGVPEEHPRPAQEEAAHQLAAEARPVLEPRGFTTDQVFEWADAFLAQDRQGDVEAFLGWVEERES